MEKKDIAAFFDRCAPWWDADMIRNERIIQTILDNAGIHGPIHVLDVACGTGVLFPDYIQRGATVTGIDLSGEMVKLAREKFPEVNVICGDVEQTPFPQPFDAVMVYNAFPHFPDPAHLIGVLADLVKPGGRLSIAHGMSRVQLLQHHAGRASTVSIDLLHEDQLATLMRPYFDVDVIVSDDQMYQVAGTRRAEALQIPVSPMDELLALMRYTVSHNDAHAQEIADLAQQLKAMGKHRAYQKIMDVVSDFDLLNAKFDAVLQELTTDL